MKIISRIVLVFALASSSMAAAQGLQVPLKFQSKKSHKGCLKRYTTVDCHAEIPLMITEDIQADFVGGTRYVRLPVFKAAGPRFGVSTKWTCYRSKGSTLGLRATMATGTASKDASHVYPSVDVHTYLHYTKAFLGMEATLTAGYDLNKVRRANTFGGFAMSAKLGF